MPQVPDRPEIYDPDKMWNEDAGTWDTNDDAVKGGNMYKNRVVVIGIDNSGDGIIYFGE